MLCYQDKTFCPYLDCIHKDCERRLTLKIRREAKKADYLICQFLKVPSCYAEKKHVEVQD
jgi:hypothetical protein